VLTGQERRSVTMTVRLPLSEYNTVLIRPSSLASDDIRDIDLTRVHNLSGPIAVEGAEPGDCLVVDILDGTPVSGHSLCPILFVHSQAI
jgi:acetamidase/formamidase